MIRKSSSISLRRICNFVFIRQILDTKENKQQVHHVYMRLEYFFKILRSILGRKSFVTQGSRLQCVLIETRDLQQEQPLDLHL